MKKLLLVVGFAAITALAHGQGTIAFGNSALTRITLGCGGNVTAADGILFHVFYGPAGSSRDALVQAPGTASVGATAGVLVNAPSVFQLPGTEGGQVVSLQIRAWDSARIVYGETSVRQVTLGPTAGPGAVIWQTAASTNPNRFYGSEIFPCPEPSTLAFAALGGLMAFFVRRKSTRN